MDEFTLSHLSRAREVLHDEVILFTWYAPKQLDKGYTS